MRSIGSRRVAHCAALVAAAVLLCIGILLSWAATGPEVPGTHAKAGGSQIAQGANGDEHPLNGRYFAVPGEEAEDSNKGPVNADLLTALLFAFFFGTTVGWLLANARRQGVFYSSGITRRLSFVTAREDTPFLGVFRL